MAEGNPVADASLTKAEVNAHYYGTVAGEVAFTTDSSLGYHPVAVAKLIAFQAAARGKRTIRILELGANDCVFAHELLNELGRLATEGIATLDRIDYLAVEFVRGALEAAADIVEEAGIPVRRGPAAPAAAVGPPARPALVALIAARGARHQANLALIHAEANQFVASTNETFDFVLLNELLDDLPGRAYYADAEGRRFELVPRSRRAGERWHVSVVPRPLEGDELADLPPGRITFRSPESVTLVAGIARLLAPGGVLIAHDYGFVESYPPSELYAEQQAGVPEFVDREYPPGSENGFPRSFFRIFANERLRVVQVTNDVNFAELGAALADHGTVTMLAHGSVIVNRGEPLERGQGVFLSEFGLLEPGDDITALLADLHANQAELRDAFFRNHAGGRTNVFLDLVFVKA
jgi:hypothetical protein